MSTSSATKKTEILTQDVVAQLDKAIHKTPCVGLAVDESTDVCSAVSLCKVLQQGEERVL